MMRLDTGGQTTLDASGNGSVILMPSNAHQTWHVQNVVVQTSPSDPTNVPECRISVGGSLMDTTYSGNNDSSDSAYDVLPGTAMIVNWSKGDPGIMASVSVTGSIEQRF
jgi:hypothetical protein